MWFPYFLRKTCILEIYRRFSKFWYSVARGSASLCTTFCSSNPDFQSKKKHTKPDKSVSTNISNQQILLQTARAPAHSPNSDVLARQAGILLNHQGMVRVNVFHKRQIRFSLCALLLVEEVTVIGVVLRGPFKGSSTLEIFFSRLDVSS